MSNRRYRGVLFVALLQVAPSPIAFDSTGRVQGVLGFGGGQYENVLRDCQGNVLGTSAVQFRGAGGQVDLWPSRSLRLTAFGGSMSASDDEWQGGYVGGLLAMELQKFGLGAGEARVPGAVLWPTGYLRIGDRDDLHFRIDIAPPSPPFGTFGAVRVGLGYRLGHVRRTNFLGGLALCSGPCNDSGVSLFGELGIPMVSNMDLELRALLGPGNDYLNSGLSVAGRFHLAR